MVISFLPDARVRILHGYLDNNCRLQLAYTQALDFDTEDYAEKMDIFFNGLGPRWKVTPPSPSRSHSSTKRRRMSGLRVGRWSCPARSTAMRRVAVICGVIPTIDGPAVRTKIPPATGSRSQTRMKWVRATKSPSGGVGGGEGSWGLSFESRPEPKGEEAGSGRRPRVRSILVHGNGDYVYM